MEPLSSFAISYAAGVALNLYNHSQASVNSEVKKAFNIALNEWCKNPSIRDAKKSSLQALVKKVFENPNQINAILSADSEASSFFNIYEKTLAQFNSAYNYLKEIKDDERFNDLKSQLLKIDDKLQDIADDISYIKSNLPESSKEIEAEWRRQLDVYGESIAEFKPQTALKLLTELESSFLSNRNQPSDTILANMEFLKSQCYDLLNKTDESYKCYIKAYTLNPQYIKFKEKACFAYTKIGEIEKANHLRDEIFRIDEFNSTAWALKIICEKDVLLEEQLSKTPQIVLNNPDFRRILFFHKNISENNSKKFIVFEDFGLFSNLDYSEKEITLLNYKDALFAIEIILSKVIEVPYIEFTGNKPKNLQEFQDAHRLLNSFMKRMSASEISESFDILYFCYWYTDYVLTGNRDSVIKMKALYNRVNKDKTPLIIIYANSLQQIGDENTAIEVIDEQKNMSIELLLLKAYCHLKLKKFDEYVKTAKEAFSAVSTIDTTNCEIILNLITDLNAFGKLKDIESSAIVDNKQFEVDFFKDLILSYYDTLCGLELKVDFDSLLSIENVIINSYPILSFYIPYALFVSEKYDLAKETFEKYVLREVESKDLFYYILSLYHSYLDHTTLLMLLERWRLNFSFNEDLLRIEAEMCYELSMWEQALVVSEYYLNKNSIDEFFLTLQLISLNKLAIRDERIGKLAKIFENFQFVFYGHAHNVCIALMDEGYYQIALNILYKEASIPGNTEARMDFFFAVMNAPDGLIKEFDTVEAGCYVQYSVNNEVLFIEVEHGNDFAKNFINHKRGDVFTCERPLVGIIDSIKVLRITDKYLRLHDEILNVIKTNPYSGIPMQLIEFKDSSADTMIKTLTELFGAKGTMLQQNRDVEYEKYYNYLLSFSQLVIQNYSSHYLAGYFDLINVKNGIAQVPLDYYPKDITLDEKEFVLDFTSLLILHQISTNHDIVFKDKFIIGKGVVDYIHTLLKKEKADQSEKHFIDISQTGVKKHLLPIESVKSNIVFYERLVGWISNNCRETVAVSKLDITRTLDKDFHNNTFLNLTIENISLVRENDGRILISDDSVYLKLYPLKSRRTISSELFIKSLYGDNNEYLSEFVKNKYIGFTIDANTLSQEFSKKLRGQQNLYFHCLNNCSLRTVPNPHVISTVVSFLKQLAMNTLVPESLFIQEAVSAFVILLKGQQNGKLFVVTERFIREEFHLLGVKYDIIKDCYNRAVEILNRTQ